MMSSPETTLPPFSKMPFYVPRHERPIIKDVRVYRPLLDMPGQNGLERLHAHMVNVLAEAGLNDSQVTVLPPDQFEVSVASRGTINTAVQASPLLEDVSPETIGSELVHALQSTAQLPVEGIVKRIKLAKDYPSNWGRPRHLGVSFLLSRGADIVGIERYLCYEKLSLWSDEVPSVAKKLNLKKTALARMIAVHDPMVVLGDKLLRSLQPKERIAVRLGEPQAAPFGNK